MNKQLLRILPFLLLKRPELIDELRLAVIRRREMLAKADLKEKRLREHLLEHIEQILANCTFQAGHLKVVLPYFDDILHCNDPKTLDHFTIYGMAIRNPDLIQMLSLAMQAVDLGYREFITNFCSEYEAHPDKDKEGDEEDWGYLPG